MDKIRIINTKNNDDYFDIPWEWLKEGTQGPTLNDLESVGERSKLNGKLTRVRCAEIPAMSIEIIKKLTQRELYPLFRLLRMVEVNIRYFEKYKNSYVTTRFYAQKPNPVIHEYPEDNNTDNIIYKPFTIDFAGYEDIDS